MKIRSASECPFGSSEFLLAVSSSCANMLFDETHKLEGQQPHVCGSIATVEQLLNHFNAVLVLVVGLGFLEVTHENIQSSLTVC